MTQESSSTLSDTGATTEYAKQWMQHLQARNRVLSIAAPLLFVLLFCAAASAVFLYIELQDNKLDLFITEQVLVKSKQEVIKLNDDKLKSVTELRSLEEALQAVKAKHHDLAQAQGESTTELVLTNKLIAAQKAKLSFLQDEKELQAKLISSTEQSNKELAALVQQNQADLTAQVTQLEQRKNAYQALLKRHKETQTELEFTVTNLDEQNEAVKRLKSQLSQKTNALAKSLQESEDLRAEGELAQSKLKRVAVIAPLITQPPLVETNADTSIDRSLAIKPIVNNRKPGKMPISSSGSELDFDPNNIAIE
jgi:chromosome segregation ATPase